MRIPRSGCIAACVLSFVSTAADAQSSYRLEERLPENTAFFISVPDVAAAGRACRELGIVQLL